MAMRNSLTFTPDFANNRVEVSIGNPGGAHAMFLSLSDLLTLEEWVATVRHETSPGRLVISQAEARSPLYMIISGGIGAPERYTAKERALAAAKRHARRCHKATEVAWCNDVGTPKVWLAYVTADARTTLTESWENCQ